MVPKLLIWIIIDEVDLDLPCGVCVSGVMSWELLLGEVACKSRGTVAKSYNGLVSVTCCSEISKPCLWSMFIYSDTSANEDNSFQDHSRQPKSSLAETSRCLRRKQPSQVGVSPLCDVFSSFLCHTHTDGEDKLLEWPNCSCLLLYVSAHPLKHSLAESEKQRKKSLLAEKFVSRVTR